MLLRQGTLSDLAALNELALAAKAHWGYAPEQLAVWRSDLTISPDSLARRPICVAEEDGCAVGFVQVATDSTPWELDGLWVHPSRIGKGTGTALLRWASDLAARNGQSELAIDADPNAEVFYVARGARVVGSVEAPIPGSPERVRPQLRLRTSAA